MAKKLLEGAFHGRPLPPYLSSDDYVRFTPHDLFLRLPGSVERSEFSLVARHQGWEYTVFKKDVGVEEPGQQVPLWILVSPPTRRRRLFPPSPF